MFCLGLWSQSSSKESGQIVKPSTGSTLTLGQDFSFQYDSAFRIPEITSQKITVSISNDAEATSSANPLATLKPVDYVYREVALRISSDFVFITSTQYYLVVCEELRDDLNSPNKPTFEYKRVPIKLARSVQ